jgi:hypothetical protein
MWKTGTMLGFIKNGREINSGQNLIKKYHQKAIKYNKT